MKMDRRKSAWAVADHRARRLVHTGARLAGWWLEPQRWPERQTWSAARDGALEAQVGEVRAPLARSDRFAEPALEAGKRRNLALATPAFDQVILRPDRPLSFWRTLGRASAGRGYTWGMELRGGCVVPAIAGGLCLLSNALFELAVRAGWRILERHGHSLEAVPPAPGSLPLDATVAWPDVDLVIAPRTGRARLAARIAGDTLELAAFMAEPPAERIELSLAESVVTRGAERVRRSRVIRSRFDGAGALVEVDEVAAGERRILDASELGRSCITCGENRCRDRPSEPVLVALRRAR
jgi:vancomycin resistance protein VanW